MDFLTPITEISRAGTVYLAKLEKLGLRTIGDLLLYFPKRYEDFSNLKKIIELKAEDGATISGTIIKIGIRRSWTNKKLLIVEAVVEDETGKIRVSWFNQSYLLKSLPIGTRVSLAGKIIKDTKGLSLANPYYEKMAEEDGGGESYGFARRSMTEGLIPVYSETKGVTSRYLRLLIKKALEKTEFPADPLPENLRKELSLPEIKKAILNIHFPKKIKEAQISRERFALEELLVLELAIIRERNKIKKLPAFSLQTDFPILKKLADSFGFKLTPSQRKTISEILKDLAKNHPMNRLLQGDVGSGKTAVAALSALAVSQNKCQTALMAPTEILALQHFETFKKMFANFDFTIGLLIASQSKVAHYNSEAKITKKDFLKQCASGEIDIAIGTQALIQKRVSFKKLGLAIIDEQHRFGVDQRMELLKRESDHKISPHLLSMTATPIPRTLALTLWGDLDISLIDELPIGRKPIITKLVESKNRLKAYQFISQQIKAGRQAFVICPLVEDSEKIQSKSATAEYKRLRKKIFPNFKIALLHGKTKPTEKEKIMTGFKNGEIDILVATAVVEVGIDIPNASVMVVEGAERFGLAQIYQFRGRVGRGEYQSYCLLFSDNPGEIAKQRLGIIANAKNSFELAEMDLKTRGPGQFLGEKQSGLPDYIMEALKDISLVKLAKESAEKILAVDPDLKKHPLLRERVENNKGVSNRLH